MNSGEERQPLLAVFRNTVKDGRRGLVQSAAPPLSRGTAPPAVVNLRRCAFGKYISSMIGIAFLRPRQWIRVRLSRSTATSPPYLHLPYQPCKEYPLGTGEQANTAGFEKIVITASATLAVTHLFNACFIPPHRRHPAMEGYDTHFALRFDRRMPDGTRVPRCPCR